MKRISFNKHSLAAALVILLFLNGSCLGLLAYSADRAQAANCFSVGYGEIAIEEAFEPPKKLLPGISIKKEVAILNTGPVPCRVRILAEYTSSRMAALSLVDFDREHWLENGDYFYYKHILQPGEKSVPLFSRIQIRETASQGELEPFDILIYGEAIQEDSLLWGKF